MSIREFNANVSSAVARAEAGEIIEITRNNRPVAELRPMGKVRDAEWERAYLEMVSLLDRGIDLGGGPITDEDKYGDAEL